MKIKTNIRAGSRRCGVGTIIRSPVKPVLLAF
jgi:hypothetical protein